MIGYVSYYKLTELTCLLYPTYENWSTDNIVIFIWLKFGFLMFIVVWIKAVLLRHVFRYFDLYLQLSIIILLLSWIQLHHSKTLLMTLHPAHKQQYLTILCRNCDRTRFINSQIITTKTIILAMIIILYYIWWYFSAAIIKIYLKPCNN